MESLEIIGFILFAVMVCYKTMSEEQNKSNSKKQYKTESKEIDKQKREKMEKIINTIVIYLIGFGICVIISVIFLCILAGVDIYDKWKKQKILEAENNRISFEVDMDKRELVDFGKNGGYYEIRKDDFRGKSVEELTGKDYNYYIDVYRQYLKNDSEMEYEFLR